MKSIVLLLTSLFVSYGFSQNGSFTETIRVINTQLQPMANIPVVLIETTTKEKLTKNTNKDGIVVFELKTGKLWSVNVLEMKDYRTIEVEENMEGSGSSTITYDLKYYQNQRRPVIDRTKLNLEKIDQTKLKNAQYSEKEALVDLKFSKNNKTALGNFPVNVTCYKTGKTYLGKTSPMGIATFLLPVNNTYEIDIDGIESFERFDVEGSSHYTMDYIYQPSVVNEKEHNDTITQLVQKTEKGTSSRVFLKIHVKQIGKNKLANEDVYLQMLKSNKVYKAKTNSEGEAYFLIPIKKKYMVHFRFEKDVDVLNYSDLHGISNAEASFTYRPDPRLQFPERYIPSPNDILIKEFTEFITKQFPEPKNEEAIGMTVSWGNDTINKKSKEAVLQIGFKAKTSNKDLYGPPINIALVIDKSGSMEGHERIDVLKIALLNYIQKLRTTDMVSLITFDDKSTVILPTQPIGDRKAFKEAIEAIETGGGTNIYNGMVDGYEQVLKHMIAKGTNRVVLLTDGYGDTPPETVIEKSKTYNAKGIELSAIGVGDSYNQSMLTLLATAGGGLLSFSGEAKHIEKAFEKELNSVLSPCAKDVNVEISYNDQLVFKQLYGFPTTKNGSTSIQMKLDNIYSGLNTLALVKFDLSKPNKEIENKPVVIRMSYYDFKKQKNVLKEEKAYLKWSESTGELELILEAQHKKLYAIAILNQSIKVMAEAYAREDYQAAREAIQSTIQQVKKLYPNAKDSDVKQLVNTLETYVVGLNTVIKAKK
jgi:uncharacterized protein YegL